MFYVLSYVSMEKQRKTTLVCFRNDKLDAFRQYASHCDNWDKIKNYLDKNQIIKFPIYQWKKNLLLICLNGYACKMLKTFPLDDNEILRRKFLKIVQTEFNWLPVESLDIINSHIDRKNVV